MNENYSLRELNEWADKVVEGISKWADEVNKAFNGSPASITIEKLDFSEHDKVFEDKIADLENIINHKLGNWDKLGITYQEILDMKAENDLLNQRIAELESKETENCEKEPKISDSAPSIDWYENRHQADCIEINRLNTTIDVLIHKVEYLRQFVGLE